MLAPQAVPFRFQNADVHFVIDGAEKGGYDGQREESQLYRASFQFQSFSFDSLLIRCIHIWFLLDFFVCEGNFPRRIKNDNPDKDHSHCTIFYNGMFPIKECHYSGFYIPVHPHQRTG